ncbi:MAG: hypothetical protein FWG23_06880 [Eggerthellaceae bacterium]|nr:hypothetical protein [Eggerthellaceae bacterium]
MTITDETKQRIDEFAKEQSRHYLDRAKMTYWEKAQAKVDRTRHKARAKAERFKMRSVQAEEAQKDLSAYMGDFVEDLLSQGIDEDAAYQRARKELAHDSGTPCADDLYGRYAEKYYDHYGQVGAWGLFGIEGPEDMGGPAGMVTGLYYSGCVLVGSVLGAVLGVVVGFLFFPNLFWIGAVVGFLAGAVLGVGAAMLLQARALTRHT